MKLLVTGAGGMLGSHVARAWSTQRPNDLLLVPTRHEVDLLNRGAVVEYMEREQPDAIIHCAAKVGGIADKLSNPFDFLSDNLSLDSHVIGAALSSGVTEFLYVASAAVYPAAAPSPITPDALLTGALEPANEGYALAKIAGIRACAYASTQYGVTFRAVAPSNLYGLGDHFDLGRAHLVPAAIAKMHAARVAGESSVIVWGDGTARREFTFAGDVAEWLVGQIGHLDVWPSLLNLGVGIDHSIKEYYEVAADIVGFGGTLEFDATKPSGVPQRLLESSEATALGWHAPTQLHHGMAAVYADYQAR
jgi:GDP-L-fucose synthase